MCLAQPLVSNDSHEEEKDFIGFKPALRLSLLFQPALQGMSSNQMSASATPLPVRCWMPRVWLPVLQDSSDSATIQPWSRELFVGRTMKNYSGCSSSCQGLFLPQQLCSWACTWPCILLIWSLSLSSVGWLWGMSPDLLCSSCWGTMGCILCVCCQLCCHSGSLNIMEPFLHTLKIQTEEQAGIWKRHSCNRGEKNGTGHC